MSGRDFARANRLWFTEGRTGEALEAYGAAHRDAPADPVVAFQYARSLWAVGRAEEARAVLDLAATHRDQLSQVGQMVIDQWRELIGQAPPRVYPGVPPVLLDRDRIDADPSLVTDWKDLAQVAHERGMDGLAVYALDRWGGLPIDAEDALDLGAIETSRSTNEAMLAEMRLRTTQ